MKGNARQQARRASPRGRIRKFAAAPVRPDRDDPYVAIPIVRLALAGWRMRSRGRL
jgi:hypothetical protein